MRRRPVLNYDFSIVSPRRDFTIQAAIGSFQYLQSLDKIAH